ncbi:hypothetical protein [Thauera butanivorans]|uniref:hypothetical protein n=1 Tax=Thauera butanivorans TaxID=86174 RepID=UPI000837EA20|nr:hypothetical protein [Thauera butanivorans]
MPTLNPRNISIEAEPRKIAEDAVQPPLRIGFELAEFWKKHGTDEDVVVTRSDEPVKKVSFE